MPDSVIAVAIVEDNADIREGFSFIINNSPNCVVTGAYPDAQTAIPAILATPPDVILMDIQMPGMSGIECVKILKNEMPDLDVLMITVHSDDNYVFDSLRAGACGYLTKNTKPERLVEAIQEANKGGAPMSSNIARMVVGSFNAKPNSHPELTRREREVLEELCNGKSYKMIADSLCVSEDTVRFHIKKIYRKLQVNSKSEAVIKAIKDRIV
ncbi:MAG: response regulator [Bacteroidia bacterium]